MHLALSRRRPRGDSLRPLPPLAGPLVEASWDTVRDCSCAPDPAGITSGKRPAGSQLNTDGQSKTSFAHKLSIERSRAYSP